MSRRARGTAPELPNLAVAPVLGEADRWMRASGFRALVGVDEVGRGPLAGPVVAAAVWLPEVEEAPLVEAGLDDSKRLTARRRTHLAEWIQRVATVGIGASGADVIDAVGIVPATARAMTEAIQSVVAQGGTPDVLLVDGNRPIDPAPVDGIPQRTLVKGDSRSVCVAAASVVAKVHRDALMVRYEALHPGYGFDSHKGYRSPAHHEALERLGPCPIHRRSFRGVVREAG